MREYGPTVQAGGMTNAEYAARYRALSPGRRMKPAPSHQRIFRGYLVVRKHGTGDEYETWMPDYVFEELYAPAVSG
jgi:hypothetical protein